jgi:hypothetical protein
LDHARGVDEVERCALDFMVFFTNVLKLLAGPEDELFLYEEFLRVRSFAEEVV